MFLWNYFGFFLYKIYTFNLFILNFQKAIPRYYQSMEVRQIAINFIKTLSPTDKQKLKIMLAHGITCGSDYARQNEIEPLQLNEELKLIFEGR